MKLEKLIAFLPFRLRDTQGLWIEADHALANGDHAGATEIYQHLVKRIPKDAESYQYQALAYTRLNRQDAAIDTLEAGLKKFPNASPEHLLDHYVRFLSRNGNIDRAIRFLQADADNETQVITGLLSRRFGEPLVHFKLLEYCMNQGLIDLALSTAVVAEGGHETLTALWGLADLLLQLERADDAATIYRQITGRVREGLDDYYYAGLAAYRLNDLDGAITIFELAIEKFPEAINGHLFEQYVRIAAENDSIERVIEAVQAAQGSSAAEVCESLFNMPSARTHILLKIVNYCVDRNLEDVAQRGLALVENSNDMDTLWAAADSWVKLGHDDHAEAIYRTVEAHRPDSKMDFFFASMAAYRLKNPERAVDILEAGLKVFRGRTDDYLFENYFRISAELGRIDRVISFQQLLDSKTEKAVYDDLFHAPVSNSHIRVGLIAYCLQHGFDERAGAGIDYMLAHHDDHLSLWLLANELLRHERTEQVEEIYRKISERPPEEQIEFYFSGVAAHRLKDGKRAVEILEAGLTRYPQLDKGDLFENYLLVIFELGQFDRAVKFVQNLLGINKEQSYQLLFHAKNVAPQIRINFIGYCLKHGWEQLAAEGMEVIYADRENLMARWMLADLLRENNRRDEEEAIYRQLANHSPNKPEGYYYASMAELRLGNTERCLQIAEAGQRAYPKSGLLSNLYVQMCASVLDFERYQRFKMEYADESGEVISTKVEFFKYVTRNCYPETFIVNYKDVQASCDEISFNVLKDDFLETLKANPPSLERAKVLMFFSRYIDAEKEFSLRLLELLQQSQADVEDSESAVHALQILYELTPPMIPHYAADPATVVRGFIANCLTLLSKSIELNEPMADMIDNWTPWQYIFCLAVPELYHKAFAAFEKMAFASWPKLNFTSPHVEERLGAKRAAGQKIRIGFTVHESMPMMSGLMGHLDKNLFDTVYLRPGRKGTSAVGDGWIARAGETVEYSDVDAYAAIETIAKQELDIIVSGPAMAAIFYPMMARLAPLQMILLEPNWTDGFTNSDYYISWKPAEPENPAEFYKSSVAFLEHPPYWIERPAVGTDVEVSQEALDEIRQRLLGCGPDSRVYLCANTLPKIHPLMDDIFFKLLDRDPTATLVFLRGDYPPGKSLKLRLREKLGEHFNRIVFLKTLSKNDAHMLLQAVDCSLDSYPLCGMSSSFDGMMLGVPIVTLPSNIPFGNWTAAIYNYIGVTGLTAQSVDEYVNIAMRLASDREWRQQKSREIRAASSRYVESKESADEFQEFLIQAWERKRAGLPEANWLSGTWQ